MADLIVKIHLRTRRASTGELRAVDVNQRQVDVRCVQQSDKDDSTFIVQST